VTAFASGLYAGAVTHRRFRPKTHRLRYSMFQMLFDLDETATLSRRLRLFSHNRFNLFSFFDRDHGDGRAGPLRGWVEETCAAAGIDLQGGRIRLLCLPRVLGHVFNPLSVYYCHRGDGTLAAMLYEVNNTFGERHSYLIAAPPIVGGPLRQTCGKAFYVSPFLPMAMTYDFKVTVPDEAVAIALKAREPGGATVLAAAFHGRRRELSDRALVRALIAYPLLTLKVVGAIHFEALKLVLKGVRPGPRPPAPAQAVTVV
jgi:uncharacterized protein